MEMTLIIPKQSRLSTTLTFRPLTSTIVDLPHR